MGNNVNLDDFDVQNRALYLAYESSNARLERVNFKLWIVVLVLIVALIGTNAGWYESQYEDTVVTQEVEAQSDDGSDLNIRTIGGDYNGGESESNTDG